MKTEQLSIFLENKPGRLAEVAEALARTKINIRALSLADTDDFGVLRLIADRPEEAKAALREDGFSAQVSEVLAVEVPDHPGGLGRILSAFDKAGVNVEYMYACVSRPRQDVAIMIFRLDDLAKALENFPADCGRIVPPSELYTY
ncbi:amino acid-binding protein [Deltaproteobacteria bacterium Smac51]|nr:amino acid-binding protein [Deltaproteobacteria bacterium Smac51]